MNEIDAIKERLNKGDDRFAQVTEALSRITTHLQSQDATMANVVDKLDKVVEGTDSIVGMWKGGVTAVRFFCRSRRRGISCCAKSRCPSDCPAWRCMQSGTTSTTGHSLPGLAPPTNYCSRRYEPHAPDCRRGLRRRGAACAQWVAPVQTACDRFQINTPLRVAAFVAQCGHESAGLARTAESFDYSITALPQVFRRITPALAATLGRQSGERTVPLERQQRIASIAYASQYGNGDDSASGDGWAFRGSGLMQLTFRANFEACGTDLSLDLAGEPDRVRADPALAALVSAWFWSTKGLNVLADAGNFLGITKRINPAMLGASHRNALYVAAKAALGIGTTLPAPNSKDQRVSATPFPPRR